MVFHKGGTLWKSEKWTLNETKYNKSLGTKIYVAYSFQNSVRLTEEMLALQTSKVTRNISDI